MAHELLRTPFGFSSTASEVIAGIDLRGKHCVITGGASGIGTETTRTLAQAGASVTVAVRRPEAAESVIAGLREQTGNQAISVRHLDVSDLDSVREFCAERTERVDILVNNAGVMAIPERSLSKQGFEMQFATNYLGHFALVLGLRRHFVRGTRIVNVSSSGHLWSPVNFDDINFDFIPYTPFGAYGQSKTASILMSVGITKKWAADGITSNALNPGAIATPLQKYTGGLKTPEHLRKTTEQGAATSVLLAASPLLEGIGGRYFEDCAESPTVTARPTDFSGGVAPYALSEANAERLWSWAEQVIAKK